ncbi:p97I [Monocercomonoides exilis]|uniref:p97I n=1 Tax=Monocercomonoides exilis TaxID=2049356 RepID=UPI00355A9530|nr:p97I [Monocercomonoides exilis]|eukprot:MONOS_6812.1-p1 / transcript=MONOS_6812.1 / gene=MONOS_6812 / organism=Monocercomonoides_exilis_PA203 / gene_product= p97I / transcript_product= p97I / location=Mono_scaffold00222:7200-9930(+) / protein_length=600 / sequence_SO=supercontig / SO=protein_coding / is_pseudo=false
MLSTKSRTDFENAKKKGQELLLSATSMDQEGKTELARALYLEGATFYEQALMMKLHPEDEIYLAPSKEAIRRQLGSVCQRVQQITPPPVPKEIEKEKISEFESDKTKLRSVKKLSPSPKGRGKKASTLTANGDKKCVSSRGPSSFPSTSRHAPTPPSTSSSSTSPHPIPSCSSSSSSTPSSSSSHTSASVSQTTQSVLATINVPQPRSIEDAFRLMTDKRRKERLRGLLERCDKDSVAHVVSEIVWGDYGYTSSSSSSTPTTSTASASSVRYSATYGATHPKSLTTMTGQRVGASTTSAAGRTAIEAASQESEEKKSTSGYTWDRIGLKSLLIEMVVFPIIRPDLFTGLRSPPKGLLLFGPPGTGKTLIARALSNEAHARFFALSASSLTSKWVGEGEKHVKALFAVAAVVQPSIIFIDEVDSLLSARSSEENESSRRMKTEFLVQMDGTTTSQEDHVVVIGATNRPWDLDDAILRRFSRRVYLPLPTAKDRAKLITSLLSDQTHTLTTRQVNEIAKKTNFYSNADLMQLCREASFFPIREIDTTKMCEVSKEVIRPISKDDFINSLKRVRPSVNQKQIDEFNSWNVNFGTDAYHMEKD